MSLAHGCGSKPLERHDPVEIDRKGSRKSTDDWDKVPTDTSCERVMALHSGTEGWFGNKTTAMDLVWPWTLVCFGCEDVEEYFSRNPDRIRRKITSEQAEEIRKRAENGERLMDIAKDYGITKSYISKIFTNRSWISYEKV